MEEMVEATDGDNVETGSPLEKQPWHDKTLASKTFSNYLVLCNSLQQGKLNQTKLFFYQLVEKCMIDFRFYSQLKSASN